MRRFIAFSCAAIAFLSLCGAAPAEDPPAITLRLEAGAAEFEEGEPIPLTFIIENISDKTVLLADHADFLVFHLLLHFEDGCFTPCVREGGEQPEITFRQYPSAVLCPGAYYGVRTNAPDYVPLPPGEHRFKVTYVNKMGADRLGFDAWQGAEVSNEVSIVIRRKDPQPARIVKLIEDLGSDDWETREKATGELIEIGEPAIDYLVRAANESDDPEVVWRANIVLERLGCVSDAAIAQKVDDILEGIRKDDWLIKETVGMEIIRLGPQVIGTLRACLGHEDHRIRQVCVELLGRIPDKKIISVLITALDDRDSYVRASAAKELRRITGQTFTSYDKDKWEEWWKANKDAFQLPESE